MFDYKAFVEDLVSKGVVFGDEIVGYNLNSYLEMPKGLEFKDVGIEQNHNPVDSRLDTDVSSEVFRGLRLQYPILASNMMAVVSPDFCNKLSDLGALGIMHRGFPTIESYLDEVKKIKGPNVAASVGSGDFHVELANRLVDCGANIIFIDVANGYSDLVLKTGKCIKENHPTIKLVVGNSINPDFLYAVNDFADAVKVNIGSGSACETRFTAGCYVPSFTALDRMKNISRHLGLPIIQDGGIKDPSDFVKAIAVGANSVMMGRNFAMCPESAGRIINTESGLKKEYFGMASRRAQNEWKQGLKPGTCAEGKTTLLDMGVPAEGVIERYGGALRSGMTYVGAKNIGEFQDKVRFIRL